MVSHILAAGLLGEAMLIVSYYVVSKRQALSLPQFLLLHRTGPSSCFSAHFPLGIDRSCTLLFGCPASSNAYGVAIDRVRN